MKKKQPPNQKKGAEKEKQRETFVLPATRTRRIRLVQRLLEKGTVYPIPASFDDLLQWQRAPFQFPELIVLPYAEALFNYDPLLLRREIEMTGLSILADPIIQLVLQKLWRERVFNTDNGKKARDCLTVLFHELGRVYGAPEYPDEKARRESLRQAKQRYDRTVKAEEARLEKSLKSEPLAIFRATLATARASKSKATQEAARRLKARVLKRQ